LVGGLGQLAPAQLFAALAGEDQLGNFIARDDNLLAVYLGCCEILRRRISA
jgi:hypothetical protein